MRNHLALLITFFETSMSSMCSAGIPRGPYEGGRQRAAARARRREDAAARGQHAPRAALAAARRQDRRAHHACGNIDEATNMAFRLCGSVLSDPPID